MVLAMTQKILIVVGPTASGKSSLAVQLARALCGEIVSADSRQVYKGLNIGTGKVTKKEMDGVPHHLLDVCSPKSFFSAGDYAKQARSVIADIGLRGKLPIIVGGTGFYIDALIGRIPLPDVPPNAKLRTMLSKKSTAQLFALLGKRDPSRAASMDTPSERNNKVRLIRALEIAHSLGKVPIMEVGPPYDALWVGIVPNDKALRENINTRLTQRISAGMIREAQKLHKAGLSYKRMEELGLEYRSLAKLLQKKITRVEFANGLERDIWRYARKQIGYWKRNKNIKWFDPKSKLITPTGKMWLKK